jgi:sRNA-binding regulator protein Hfq
MQQKSINKVKWRDNQKRKERNEVTLPLMNGRILRSIVSDTLASAQAYYHS